MFISLHISSIIKKSCCPVVITVSRTATSLSFTIHFSEFLLIYQNTTDPCSFFETSNVVSNDMLKNLAFKISFCIVFLIFVEIA